MHSKKFGLSADQIKPLVAGRGARMATDMITVHGKRAGYAYREAPRWPQLRNATLDSGWVFLSGTESQEYLDNPDNLAIYDVNTIANYDQDIIPLLDAPVGSAFTRDSSSFKFVPVAAPSKS
jgi:hypothetical protein